jgi:hypothetical protein
MDLCLLVVQNFLLDSGFKQLQRAMLARSSHKIALLDHYCCTSFFFIIVINFLDYVSSFVLFKKIKIIIYFYYDLFYY